MDSCCCPAACWDSALLWWMCEARRIFAFACLEAVEFYQTVVRGLNISLSGNPSNENICSGEAGRQREPVDRLTPAAESGFPQNGSDSFTSTLYIAIDRRSRIKAWREVLARLAQFPSSRLDVEFVHRCLIQFAALTPARSEIERCGEGVRPCYWSLPPPREAGAEGYSRRGVVRVLSAARPH